MDFTQVTNRTSHNCKVPFSWKIAQIAQSNPTSSALLLSRMKLLGKHSMLDRDDKKTLIYRGINRYNNIKLLQKIVIMNNK